MTLTDTADRDYDSVSLFCRDSSEGAAYGLLALMTGISEEFWCAGWIDGLEDALWRIEPGAQYGQGVISVRQARLLRELSDEAGGWFFWTGDGTPGPRFVALAEWERLKGVNP